MRLHTLLLLALIGATLYAAALLGDVAGRALAHPLAAAILNPQNGH